MPKTYSSGSATILQHMARGKTLRQAMLMDGLGITTGNVFYVDGRDGYGNDEKSGKNPEEPMLTLTAALARCTNDNNDFIFVKDYWQPTGETWPISINKNRVHIIGLANPGPLPYPAIHPTGDTAAFQLTSSGQYCEIAQLTVGGGNSHGGVDAGNEGQVDGMWIHDILFGHSWFGTPLCGIYFPTGGSRGGYGNRIERCRFLGDLNVGGGAITGDGIYDENAAQTLYDLDILDCTFLGTTIGINLAKASGGQIMNNVFTISDGADGEAITLQAGCAGGMIVTDNRAGNLATDPTNNPFRDLGGTKSHWGLNYKGVTATLPATT